MNSPFQMTLRLLAALVGLVGLGSCGGGDGDGPKEQTIALFSPIPDQPFSTIPVPLTALSSSGLAVEFSTSTAAVCTVSGSTVRMLSAGSCTVAANQSGNDSFMPAPAVLRSFTVTLADQVITFVSPGNQVFGTAPPALLAVSTSGLPVTLVSATPAVCAVAGTTLSLLDLGTCTLAALQAGNSIYRAAPVVQQTFAVSTRGLAQTISFASPGPQVLNVPPAALVATASSGLAVSFASTTPNVCTVAGKTLSLLTSGSCTVAASQAGDQNFAAAVAVLNTFTVSGLAQTITFSSPGNQTLGVQPAALAATATSGLAVSFSSTTPAVCVVNGTVLALVNVGNCSVTASQDGNAMFAAATPVVRAFSVAPAGQTITFAGPGNQTLGTAAPPLAATSSLGLEVSFASTTPAVCTTSGTSLTLSAAGTCSITASQAGNALVAAAVPVSRSFQVAAAAPTAQTITFAGPGNQTLGTAPPPLTATASSGLTVSFASTTPSTCAVSGNTLTLVAAGSCIIDARQAGNATYAAAPTVSRVVTVATAAQTITFASPGNQTMGTSPPPLVASASSGLPVSLASSTPAVCMVSGSTLTLVAVGTCTLNASQAGNATYAPAAPVTHSITVGSAPLLAQTIAFAGPGNQTMGTAPPPLSATATSGLPVSFASTTPAVCTVAGAALTLMSAGTCTLNADQAGNATYAAAATVTRSVTVSKATQSIAFAGPGNQTLGTGPFALSATATSGLPVSFASTTPAVCMVAGTTLTLVSVGTCSIEANQGGNVTYFAAAAVTSSITVSPAPLLPQSINFADPGPQTLLTATPALSANATSGLPVSFASTTPLVCTVSGTALTLVAAGTCSIDASQAGNAAFLPATPVTRSVTVSKATQTIAFTDPGNQSLGTPPVTLSATATSGLTVTFASSTTTVCTVTGNTLTLLTVGTCTVTANQAGNSTFAMATQVTVSLTVGPDTNVFANGGFETVGTTTPAFGWLAAANGYTRSTDARTGNFSAQLSSAAFGAAVMLQNSVEQGLNPPLTVNASLELSFWAKGTAGGTGNVLYAIRYLDSVGNIKYNSQNRFFQGSINPNTWTRITFQLPPVPAGSAAAFIEFSQAIGPISGNPGEAAGLVLIDDLSLRAFVPPP